MRSHRRSMLGLLGAAAAIAVYWAADGWIGSFAAARRYGRAVDGTDWAFVISAGEWRWYAAGMLIALAAGLLLFFWPAMGDKRRPPRPIFFALAAVLLAFFVRTLILQDAPIYDDEMVYRFQAQTLAGGNWTAPPPPEEKAFEQLFLGVYRGRWFGQYGFGHPLVLALGELLRVVDLVGPLLAGLLVLLIFFLARRLFDEQVAALAAVLAAYSPMFAGTAATLLAQNSATPLVLLGVLFALKAAESARFTQAFTAAFALGAAFWCRSQEPVLLGLAPLLLVIRRIVKGPRRVPLAAGLLLGAAATIGPLLLLQWRLWGHAFWTNYQAYWWGYLGVDFSSPYGFGPMPWENAHTPLVGFRSLLNNLVRLDAFLIGVPLALVLAVAGFWPSRRRAETMAALAGVPLTFLALFFYFWPGLADTGPQLYHAAGAALLPFVAAGLLRLAGRRLAPMRIAALVIVAAAVTFWPVQLAALKRAAAAGDEIPQLVQKAGVDRAVVFTELRPWRGGYDRCWVLGRPLPRPDLSDPVIYLRTWGKPVDTAVAARLYPDRSVWFFKLIDGRAALLPLAEFTGPDSLRAAARTRDLPPPDPHGADR